MKLKKKLKKLVGKLLFDHKKTEKLDLSKVETILFLQHTNKIGDMLVNTHAFRELKESYPNIKIDVLGGKSNIDIIKENPYINKIYCFENYFKVKELSKNNYDVCYYHVEESDHIFDYLLLRLVGAKVNIARGKTELNLIDVSIEGDFSRKKEIDKFDAFLDVFKITPKSRKYDIFLTKEELRNAKKSIEADKINIVFNRHGANKRRTFNDEVTLKILNIILSFRKDINLILLGHKSKRESWFDLTKNLEDNRIKIPEISTIRESASIIYYSDLVITPETSIVHIACAFRKHLIAVYRKKAELWQPITKESVVVFSKNKNKKDVNYIDLDEFERTYQEKLMREIIEK